MSEEEKMARQHVMIIINSNAKNNALKLLRGGCMVEWTNTGPNPFFLKSIPLKFSIHTRQTPVIQTPSSFIRPIMDFQTPWRACIRAVGWPLIVWTRTTRVRGSLPPFLHVGCPLFTEPCCTPEPRSLSPCRIRCLLCRSGL